MRPPSPEPAPPAADLAACRETLRGGSRTFFAASLMLPARVRLPASALYAFCRSADDAVDLEGGRAEAIARLRERLNAAYARRPLPQPVDRAFAEVVDTFAIPRALPEALLEGLTWDAEGRRYRDESELIAYAARVAGTVGAMMAILMGRRGRHDIARALDLGVAMQLTNIARDVGEDARASRLYLPTAWLLEAGIEPEAFLRVPAASPALAQVVRRLLTAADRLYRRADEGISRLPLACRPGIRAARLLYAEIGREVERHGLDSVRHRAVVSPARKASLLPFAIAADPRGGAAGATPPLQEAKFLVDAVIHARGPALDAQDDATSAAVLQGLQGRVAWVIDLFDRLERRDQVGGSDLEGALPRS